MKRRVMKSANSLLPVAILTLALLAAGVVDGKAGPLRLNMGSTKATSSIYVAGQVICDVINKYAGDVVLVTHVETSGGKDDMVRLKRGDIDAAPAGTGLYHVRDFYRGVGSQDGKAPVTYVRQWHIIGTGPYQIVTPARKGFKTASDLQGKRVSPGSPGSGAESVMVPCFEKLGIKPKWYRGSYRDAVAAMKNRELDGYIKYCQKARLDATMLDLLSSIPLKAVGFTKEEKEKLAAWNRLLIWHYVKIGEYRELPNDGDFWLPAGCSSGGLTSKIPQEVGYRMSKAVWEHIDQILKAFPSLTPDNPKEQLQAAADWVDAGAPPLHAGMVQYYKELALDVPWKLIPPEYHEK